MKGCKAKDRRAWGRGYINPWHSTVTTITNIVVTICTAGMYIENEDGKLVPLKADHDVLNLKESQVVVVEIKD